MIDVFGLSANKPPYKLDEGGLGMTDNWKKTRENEYFVYYQCKSGGSTWCERAIKEKYVGRIPNELLHAPISKLDKHFNE